MIASRPVAILATTTLLIGSMINASAVAAREKETHCKWKTGITKERLAKSDRQLHRSKGVRHRAAVAEHLPFGMPERTDGFSTSGEALFTGPHFLIYYDKDLRTPLWTANHLTGSEAAITGRSPQGEKRRDSFRSDPRLGDADRSECADYKEPIFDQGHMVPNGDLDFITSGMNFSMGMDHSFIMSNMTPQHCSFNRGPWQVLEVLARQWAADADDQWVVTGSVFDRDSTAGRDADANAFRMNGKKQRRVAIPSHLFKIIAQHIDDEWHVLSLLVENSDTKLENSESKKYLQDRVSSLDEIANHTGFSFLQNEDTVIEYTELWEETSWPGLLSFGCKDDYPDR